MDAVEDQSLVHDHADCQRAAATLTHPRRRIEAEIGWFPGIAPNAAARASETQDLDDIEALGLSGLPRANSIIGLLARKNDAAPDELTQLVSELFQADDAIDVQRLLVEINEDRDLAGFPPIPTSDPLADELERRRTFWRQALLQTFERLPTEVMAEGMFQLATVARETRFPRGLHSFIDDYGFRAQPFMSAELARAERLAEKVRALAGNRPDALEPLIAAFGKLLETWQRLTFPMHISLAARGQSFDESEQMAGLVRDLAIELNNKHNLVEQAKLLSRMNEQAFAAAPAIAALLAADLEALHQLSAEARQQEADMAYSAKIGLFGGSILSVTSAGLEWKGQFYPTDAIRAARWGGVRKSVNGVPTGTDYLIAWTHDSQREVVITFGKGEIFEGAVSRIFRLLITPVLNHLFNGLRSGRDVIFGSTIVRDHGVVLRKPKFFGSDPIEYPWSEISILSLNGNLVISATDHPKAKAELSYRDIPNVHFLEVAIRAIFKNGSDRLSGAFGA